MKYKQKQITFGSLLAVTQLRALRKTICGSRRFFRKIRKMGRKQERAEANLSGGSDFGRGKGSPLTTRNSGNSTRKTGTTGIPPGIGGAR